MSSVKEVNTFGDMRKLMLETIVAIRDKEIPVSNAQAIFEGMDKINKNFQVEVNIAKLAIATKGTTHEFGSVVRLGKQVIASDGLVD